MNASSWVRRWATLTPDAPALIDLGKNRRQSWAQLAEGVDIARQALKQNSAIKRGQPIAMLMTGRAEVFHLAFACMELGAAFTPLNWRLHAEELGGTLDDCQPALLVHDDDYASVAETLATRDLSLRLLNIDDQDRLIEMPHPPHPPALSAPDDVAMILYTSGTTGAPKGVMLSHRQLLFNALNTLHTCDIDRADRALAFLPLFHTGGLNCLALPCFYRGAAVVLMPRFDAGAAIGAMQAEAITLTIAVPAMYRMLLDAALPPHAQLPELKMLLCGGAPCPPDLLRRYWALGHPLRQGYGLTEVGPNCFTMGPQGDETRIGSVGRPAFHSQARVAGPGGEALEPGEIGELQLSGPHVTLGYRGRPEATAAAFVTDAIGRRWFCTGDLAQRDAEGYFSIVGRKKEMFISGGENVYPAEIERVLSEHPAVKDVCVVGIPDERWGEVGFAAVELAERAEVDGEALRLHCAQALARYKVPRVVHIIEALPRGATGKVQRPAVKALATRG